MNQLTMAGRYARWTLPALLVVAMATASCSMQPAPPRPLSTAGPERVPAAASSIDPTERAAEQVLEVYEAFRDVEDELSQQPRPSDEVREALDGVLGSTFHTQVWAALAAIHDDGLVRQARPESTVEVVEVRLEEQPPTAILRECLDVSGAPLVHAGSGELAGDELRGELWMAASTPGRYVRIIEAGHYQPEGWLLRHGSWAPEESC